MQTLNAATALAPLNPNSPIPLYHQLATALGAAIGRGLFKPGERLPSEPQLAARFGVTRPTVRHATRLLAEQRLVQARRGSGTFVREPDRQIDLFSLAGTLEAFEHGGIQLERQLTSAIQKVPVAPELSSNPFAGRIAYQFERVSKVDDRPLLLERFYADARVFPELEAFNLSVKSFARVVREHYFLRPERGRQTFQSLRVDPRIAAALAMEEGAPVLLVRRWIDFPAAADAVYVELFCRTDEFAFSQTLEGPK